MLGHDHTHLAALLTQTAYKIYSFINGNTAGYSQNNFFAL